MQYWNKWFIFILGVFVTGCVSIEKSNTATLSEQAKAFWNARVAGDWGTVYDILSPEDEEKQASREDFSSFRKEKGPFRYLSADLHAVEISGNKGWVRVVFRSGPTGLPDSITSEVQKWQIWQNKNGWHPVPKNEASQFPTLPPVLRLTQDQVQLKDRINTYWQAKTKQKWDDVYEFLEPGFKTHLPKEQYQKNKSLYDYVTYRIAWVEAKGDDGRARIDYTYRYNDPTVSKMPPEKKVLIEEWVKIEDEWFKNMRQDRSK